MPPHQVPPSHPRAASLAVRQRLVDGHAQGIVATHGLLAHGRGEAFDYLLGERTTPAAARATEAAAAALVLAQRPVARPIGIGYLRENLPALFERLQDRGDVKAPPQRVLHADFDVVKVNKDCNPKSFFH